MRKLMTKLEKQPKDQLFMATVAEGHLFGDTAEVWIDELYLPFAEAIANNKRISKAEKARFVNQAEVLRNSMVGVHAPSLPYTLRDGSQGNLQADSAQVVVLFFNDPDCSDCNMARLRLDADISMNELIKDGLVKVVAISVALLEVSGSRNCIALVIVDHEVSILVKTCVLVYPELTDRSTIIKLCTVTGATRAGETNLIAVGESLTFHTEFRDLRAVV